MLFNEAKRDAAIPRIQQPEKIERVPIVLQIMKVDMLSRIVREMLL